MYTFAIVVVSIDLPVWWVRC